MVDEDACISLEEVASALNISSGGASSILRNSLGYRRDCARWLLHIVTPQQKRRYRVAYSTALLRMYEHCDPKASRWTGICWWNLAVLFWTFEKSNEQSMGTERWGRAPTRKAMPLREEGTLHSVSGLQGIVPQTPARQERASRGSPTACGPCCQGHCATDTGKAGESITGESDSLWSVLPRALCHRHRARQERASRGSHVIRGALGPSGFPSVIGRIAVKRQGNKVTRQQHGFLIRHCLRRPAGLCLWTSKGPPPVLLSTYLSCYSRICLVIHVSVLLSTHLSCYPRICLVIHTSV